MQLTKFEFLLLSLRLLSISPLLFVTVNGVNSVYKSFSSPFESIFRLYFRSHFCHATSPFYLNFMRQITVVFHQERFSDYECGQFFGLGNSTSSDVFSNAFIAFGVVNSL